MQPTKMRNLKTPIGLGLWEGVKPEPYDAQAAAAGRAGERVVTQALRDHGLRVWPDVRVASDRDFSQCDQIVFGAFGLIVIETKHWTGRVWRLNEQQWAQEKPNGNQRTYRSPETQNAYHCEVVNWVLRQGGIKGVPIRGAIVLSNPHATFDGRVRKQPIGTPEKIARWIDRLPPAKHRVPGAARVERILRTSMDHRWNW